jgi:sugar-specific transcriptional regulator TrmB
MYLQLKSIGLTESESKLYLALLDLGKMQAGVLSRKTGIHRRSIYDILDRLIEKGLVSYIQENNKRYYSPNDPKKIQELIEEQRSQISKLMPELENKYKKEKSKQETLFFRGKEGLKSIFDDQITEEKDIYVIGGTKSAKEILSFYLRHYTNKRVEKKIKMYAIYAGERHTNPIPLANVKYLPETFASPVSTNIYGNKVAIILWSADPVAILIKQPEIAKAYKNYFDLLWKIAKV